MILQKYFFIVALFCASSFFLPVFAQETLTLTVDQAVEYALTNSRTLKSAAIELEMKKRQKDTAWNVFVPSVNANAGPSRSNEVSDGFSMMNGIISMINPLYAKNGFPNIPLLSPQTSEDDHWAFAGGISASLTLSFALIDSIKATFANYEAGLINWEQTVKETERDIRKIFYGILIQQENITLQKTMLENARQRWRQAEISFRSGLVPELTVLQTRVAYENMKPNIFQLELTVRRQLALFGFLIGVSFGTEINLQGKITPHYIALNTVALTEKYVQGRLDVTLLKKNLQLLQIQLSASKLQTFTPALALNYNYAPAISPLNNNWLDNNNWYDSGRFSVTLAWNLTNMLPFSANMQGVFATRDKIKQLEFSLEDVLQNAQIEIDNLVNQLLKSQQSLDAMKYNVGLARRAYDLTMEGFKSGTKELLEVRDAESQLLQASLGILQENFTYISGLLDLEYAVNARLSE